MKEQSRNAEDKSRTSKRTRRNIVFELSEPDYRALYEDACRHKSDSIHQRVRDVVIDFLSQASAGETAERLSAIEQELIRVSETLQNIEKLVRRLGYLVIAVSREHESDEGKKARSDEANRWVKEHMM